MVVEGVGVLNNMNTHYLVVGVMLAHLAHDNLLS